MHAGEAVDRDLGGEGQELRGPVLPDREPEQLGGLVDEPGRAAPFEEVGMRRSTLSRNGMLVFTPRTRNSWRARSIRRTASTNRRPLARDLDQQRVVERGDDAAGDRRAAVEPEAEAARRAVVGDPAVVGGELVRRVFGGDPALDGVAEGLDRVLVGEADLGVVERRPPGRSGSGS